MTSLTKDPSQSDLVLWEVHIAYTRETLTVEGYDITGTADAAIELKIGRPLAAVVDHNYCAAVTGGEANIVAIALENVDIAAGETAQVACMVRGSANIRYAALPTTDNNDSDYTMATVKSTLAALRINTLDQPATTESPYS